MAHDFMFFSSLFSALFPVFPHESVLQQYVVSIDGNDPFIKWQMERGLDWTISSVAGESYRVDVSRAFLQWCKKYSDSLLLKPHTNTTRKYTQLSTTQQYNTACGIKPLADTTQIHTSAPLNQQYHTTQQ